MAIRVWAVGHDTADAEKIARFLSEALRRPIRDGTTSAFAAIEIADAALLTYRQVPEGKTVKNRMHPNLISTDFAADVTRLLDLGAAQLNDVRTDWAHWITFADPEGNEFDLVAG
jgi:hypothetical protein